MANFGYLGNFLLFCILLGIVTSSHAQLQLNFYAKSCPKAEKIIQDYVQKHIPNAPSLAAALLRLQFHDCFVRVSFSHICKLYIHSTVTAILEGQPARCTKLSLCASPGKGLTTAALPCISARGCFHGSNLLPPGHVITTLSGCDGSVLLNFTSSTKNQTEKVAIPNQTLRGFSFIDDVKKIVEAECPGVVSCADIVALVSRDSVVVTGGPYWNVPTGRRDGRISNASEALANIPPPTSNFSSLKTSFASKGLDLKDLVLLSGAHTIGVSHCSSFSTRLYNFTGVLGTQDPSLDSDYAANLKAKKCKSINDNTTIVEMDPGSSSTFDLSYFKLLLKRKGLFQSDAALTTSATTKSYINKLVQGSLKQFNAEFAKAMEKMGSIEVKTGSAGEIRKQCAFVNSEV